MSLDEKKQKALRDDPPVHTQKPDCPMCKELRELRDTVPVCYESSSKQAGEDTRRFED